MKAAWILFLGLCLGWPTLALANPFLTQYVCVPKVNPNESPLEFRIREGFQCGTEETLMQVYAGPDGSTLLYPGQIPLAPEVKSDLENYKKYMGIH